MRIISGFFLISILGLLGFIIYEANRPDLLPVGSVMPKLQYHNANGIVVLRPDSINSTMVVLFHPECDHCKYQLKLFNYHLNQFGEANIIFLTTQNTFLEDKEFEQWKNISCAQNVSWGIVDKDEFKRKMGNLSYPSILIFNKSGELCSKIRGEVKLGNILKDLRNLDGPERQISGVN